jgi:hypothetical protein
VRGTTRVPEGALTANNAHKHTTTDKARHGYLILDQKSKRWYSGSHVLSASVPPCG